jgi:hypothetical protein
MQSYSACTDADAQSCTVAEVWYLQTQCPAPHPASTPQTPPRGLQLQLGPPGGPPEVDTLVMANLAYFQLKAAPGRWGGGAHCFSCIQHLESLRGQSCKGGPLLWPLCGFDDKSNHST